MGTVDVLVISAGYGAGHNQTAAAVRDGLAAVWPGCRTHILDYLTYFPPGIGSASVDFYKFLCKYLPPLYGGVYRLTDMLKGRRMWDTLQYGMGRLQLKELLAALDPKVIVCTHPLPMGILADMRKAGERLPPVTCIMTDFELHREWLQPELDHYWLPNDALLGAFVRFGIARERVSTIGIPVRKPFWTPLDQAEARRQLGLAQDQRIILYITSALGTLGGVARVCARLLRSPEPFALVVIAGRDERLYRDLQRLAARVGGERLRPLRFVDNVAQLMAASDLVITKAGGITTSEALARGRPIVIYRPIPGQEAGNSRYLSAKDAAMIAYTPRQLRDVVTQILADEAVRARLERGARGLAAADSALVIARAVCRQAGHEPV
ncbi:MAG: glycosyltransferase [Firmicutes bacterium]|nr:glycosyltransferase [Bacillota bacterium]